MILRIATLDPLREKRDKTFLLRLHEQAFDGNQGANDMNIPYFIKILDNSHFLSFSPWLFDNIIRIFDRGTSMIRHAVGLLWV